MPGFPVTMTCGYKATYEAFTSFTYMYSGEKGEGLGKFSIIHSPILLPTVPRQQRYSLGILT